VAGETKREKKSGKIKVTLKCKAKIQNNPKKIYAIAAEKTKNTIYVASTMKKSPP